MDVMPGFSTAFRVLRGDSGQWEVLEEGKKSALASFNASQAALSFACSIADEKNGSLVVVFDQPRRQKTAARASAHQFASTISAFAGQAS